MPDSNNTKPAERPRLTKLERIAELKKENRLLQQEVRQLKDLKYRTRSSSTTRTEPIRNASNHSDASPLKEGTQGSSTTRTDLSKQRSSHWEADKMKTTLTVKSLHHKLRKKDDNINTLKFKLRLAEKSWEAMKEASSGNTLKLSEQVCAVERELSDSQQSNRVLQEKLDQAESKLKLWSKEMVNQPSASTPGMDSERQPHITLSLYSDLAKKSSRIVRLEHELEQARADFACLCQDGTNSMASSISSETNSTFHSSIDSLSIGADGFPVVPNKDTDPVSTDPLSSFSSQGNVLDTSRSSDPEAHGEMMYWD